MSSVTGSVRRDRDSKSLTLSERGGKWEGGQEREREKERLNEGHGATIANAIGLKMGGSRVGSELYQQTIYSSLEEPFSTGSSISQKLCVQNTVGAGGGGHGCGLDSIKQ